MKSTTSAKLKILVMAFFAGLGLFMLISSVLETKVTAQQPPGAAFSHEQHLNVAGAGLNCVDCHRPTTEGAVMLVRPDHASCNTCHQDWFAPELPRKDFCTVCHTTAAQDQIPELKPFPNYDKDDAILFDFSHKQHLHLGGKVTQIVGARLDCNVCHQLEPSGEKATFPAHNECAVCHNQPDIKPSLRSDAANQDCLGCHTRTEQDNPNYKKVRRFITDPARAGIRRGAPSGQIVDVSAPSAGHGNLMTGRDLKFSHQKHLTDNRNEGIACETCHIGIDQKTSISQLNIPSMWDCTMCHESRRTRSEFRISNCSVCHTDITAGREPRNHTLTQRPSDHTAAFRTRHAEAARAPDAKCAFCHEMVSDPRLSTAGIVRTEERYIASARSCDECHTVMKPQSHTVRWRSDLHGRMAAMNRMNCAVCHQTDFCVRCHNQRPRNHNPINAFVNGGHRFAAALNVRSCFVCHEFTQSCERCHSPVLR